MKISPCDNCKRKEGCAVPPFLMKNRDISVFSLADQMVNMPVLVSIVSMDTAKEEIVLECDATQLIDKPKNTYEALINSKPQKDNDCCQTLLDRCKRGDCGGCKH